jgi:hypothetical protein
METLIATYVFAMAVVAGYAGYVVVTSRRASKRLRELQALHVGSSEVVRPCKVA